MIKFMQGNTFAKNWLLKLPMGNPTPGSWLKSDLFAEEQAFFKLGYAFIKVIRCWVCIKKLITLVSHKTSSFHQLGCLCFVYHILYKRKQNFHINTEKSCSDQIDKISIFLCKLIEISHAIMMPLNYFFYKHMSMTKKICFSHKSSIWLISRWCVILSVNSAANISLGFGLVNNKINIFIGLISFVLKMSH